MKCPHCSENLCAKFLERHSETVHDELVLVLKKLDGVIQQATDFVRDGSFVKQQKKKETDTVNEIKQAILSHKDELDKLEKQLKQEVGLTKEQNLASFRHSLGAKAQIFVLLHPSVRAEFVIPYERLICLVYETVC